MSKTKHTPGPWVAVEQHSGSVQIQHQISTVAVVPPTTLAEYQANARLIAAAPDLFEACIDALARLQVLAKQNGILLDEIDILKSVIAKAGGAK